jgi:N-acetylglucosaminyldiphosphoundecaprenol N-acetyl-beta-D-mannosaminyltransferase
MAHKPPTSKDVIILGVRIDDVPEFEILDKVKAFITSNECNLIFTPNPEICLKAKNDRDYAKLLNKADLNIPDGVGLKLGAEILDQKLENRLTGVDLTKMVLKHLNDKSGHTIFIITKPDPLSSLEEINEAVKQAYPSITVKGATYNDNLNTIIGQINSIRPTVLFTVLGAPEQEQALVTLKEHDVNASLCMAVGGTFDFITGKQTRAPKWWRDLGMEWFYRFLKQPKRVGRITDATIKFPLACHEWKKRIETTYRQNVVAVITKDGKFLVQKNKRFHGEHWQFPQGGIDEGEDAQTAAIREAAEELGTKEDLFSIAKKLPATHKYNPSRWHQLLRGYKGQEQQFYLLDFHGSDTDFDLDKSEEAEETKWVDKNDLLKVIHPHRQDALKKLLPYL